MNAIVAHHKPKLLEKFGERFNVEPQKVLDTLSATCFRGRDGEVPSQAQMIALLIVADQYGLNPFTREIYAFPDKSAGIVPVVGVDGWVRICNSHSQFDGIEFSWSDDLIQIDEDHKPAPAWCEAKIFRKDRTRPIIIREYLDEVYRPAFTGRGRDGSEYKKPGPWQSHTKRFLRHKALIQCARVAFGFAGIYDEDEAQDTAANEARIIDYTPGEATGETAEKKPATTRKLDALAGAGSGPAADFGAKAQPETVAAEADSGGWRVVDKLPDHVLENEPAQKERPAERANKPAVQLSMTTTDGEVHYFDSVDELRTKWEDTLEAMSDVGKLDVLQTLNSKLGAMVVEVEGKGAFEPFQDAFSEARKRVATAPAAEADAGASLFGKEG